MVDRSQNTPVGENPTFNLNLNLPVISSEGLGGDSFESAAEKINEALRIIDNHNHSPGKGKGVPYSALCADSDLNVNEYNINRINILNLIEILQPNITKNQSLYVLNKDLYFRDGFGNNIRITSGGQVVLQPSGSTRQSFLSSPVAVSDVRYNNGILYVSYHNLESGSQIGQIFEYDIRQGSSNVATGQGAPGSTQSNLPDSSFYIDLQTLSLFIKLDGQWQDLTRRGEQGPQGLYRVNIYRYVSSGTPSPSNPSGGSRVLAPSDWSFDFPSTQVSDPAFDVYQSFAEYDSSNNTLTDWSVPFEIGNQGPPGVAGPGVARGGTLGQILSKSSGIDFETEWIDPVNTNIQNFIPLYQRSASSLSYADRPVGGMQEVGTLSFTSNGVPTGWSLTVPPGNEDLYISFALLKPISSVGAPFKYTTPWNIPVGTGVAPAPTPSTYTIYAGISLNSSFGASDFTESSRTDSVAVPTWTSGNRYIAFAWPVLDDQGNALHDPTELHFGNTGLNQLGSFNKQLSTIIINSLEYEWWVLEMEAPQSTLGVGITLVIR